MHHVVSTGNNLRTIIAVWPRGADLGDEGKRRGIRCAISSFHRLDMGGHLPKAKIPGHYVNGILAKDEARRNGYDEALMMDEQGHVLEGSSENLFIVRDGIIYTPPLEANILGGITRDAVITLAHEAGYPIRERLFGRDTLYLADEVFLTGTAAEITPVREIDGRLVGEGAAGSITRALQDRFDAIVRATSPDHDQWRTHYDIAARSDAVRAA